MPSQSANPALQVAMRQVPVTQAGVPLFTAHSAPHAPQLLRLLVRLISQPSDTAPLQSAKPVLQTAMRHVPLEQAGAPFGVVHSLPQAPQLLSSPLVLVSHPLV